MRALHRGFAACASVAALLTATAVAAEVHAAPPAEEAAVRAPGAGEPEDFGASCQTLVEGSRVTAHCRNPYPRTDRIRLHVECALWWDVDNDSAPVDVGPADYATVSGRCWKRVGAAWITHEPVTDPGPPSAVTPDPAPRP
ncbi:hypothetical protein [Streptomyces termitum]|uniref:hypothetical protein n=1 Tax=Streptomyces termitum TaxID=67368 RepID=UPI0033A65174